jgi:hypothetical protein
MTDVTNLPRSYACSIYVGLMREVLTLTDLPRLDVRTLARQGYLEPGEYRTFVFHEGSVTIVAGSDFIDAIGESEMRWATTTVSLVTTRLTYGCRKWFRCPTCDRRCAILFLDRPGLYRAKCSNKPYLSATLGRKDRRLLRHQVLADRCGTTVMEGRPTRPRWMRQARWERLLTAYDDAQAAVVSDIERRRCLDPDCHWLETRQAKSRTARPALSACEHEWDYVLDRTRPRNRAERKRGPQTEHRLCQVCGLHETRTSPSKRAA